MPRIENYATKTATLTAQDKWIGTDSSGNVTKNFSPQGIASYINSDGAVAISGQNNFLFTSSNPGGRQPGTISLESYGGDGNAFSTLGTLVLSEKNNGLTTVIDYMLTLAGKRVLLAEIDNANEFGVYDVLSITPHPITSGFYNMVLDYVEGNGTLTGEVLYSFSVYPSDPGEVTPGTGDLTYTHIQSVASVTWVVAHNLGKYPNVTNINAVGEEIETDVTHNSVNQYTVTWGTATTGTSIAN